MVINWVVSLRTDWNVTTKYNSRKKIPAGGIMVIRTYEGENLTGTDRDLVVRR